jgi:polyferredoxin
MNYLVCSLIIGLGATAVMDVWVIARKRLLGIAAPDYGLVGRWITYSSRGRFRHESIKASPPVHNEKLIGWVVHYLTGIVFAATLVGAWGLDWVRYPTILPALVVGIGTVAAPFLIMQPAMGMGIGGSRTPRPASVRLQSFITHTVFGVGLYLAGWAAHFLYSP